MDSDRFDEHRDERGRFTKGNPGSGIAGPGRPRKTRLDYREAGAFAVSVEEYVAIVRLAVEDALEGNVRAREFVQKVVSEIPNFLDYLAAPVRGGPPGEDDVLEDD